MLRTLIGCLGLALATSAQASEGTPGTAIFICYGKTDDLVVVLEQTNPEEVDGKVLMDPEVYDSLIWGRPSVNFNARVFSAATAHMIDGTHQEVAMHLLSDEIPTSAFQEFNEGVTGEVALNSFEIYWGLNEEKGKFDYMINYKPSNKVAEFLYDADGNQFRVNCIDPFLKS